MNTTGYFVGCAPVGCVEQNPVVDSRGKAQMQPLLHGWLALQLPPQAKPWASLRNCRAERVPAPRVAASIATSNKLLMIFPLIFHSPLRLTNFTPALAACYFFTGTAPASFVVQNAVNGVVKEQTQPLAQAWVRLQVPPQVVDCRAWLCNWRAETVPAQRAAVAMIANKRVGIVFLIIVLPFNYSTTKLWRDVCSPFHYLITFAPGMDAVFMIAPHY